LIDVCRGILSLPAVTCAVYCVLAVLSEVDIVFGGVCVSVCLCVCVYVHKAEKLLIVNCETRSDYVLW